MQMMSVPESASGSTEMPTDQLLVSVYSRARAGGDVLPVQAAFQGLVTVSLGLSPSLVVSLAPSRCKRVTPWVCKLARCLAGLAYLLRAASCGR